MAIFQIVKSEDEILHQEAKEIEEVTPQVCKLLDNLKDTLYATSFGVGIAAPQIGISKRVVVVDLEDDLYELINPEITEREGLELDTEGCLSVPGLIGDVIRAKEVTVKALNREGKEIVVKAEGLLARAFQHEIDHLDGILYIDKAENIRQAE